MINPAVVRLRLTSPGGKIESLQLTCEELDLVTKLLRIAEQRAGRSGDLTTEVLSAENIVRLYPERRAGKHEVINGADRFIVHAVVDTRPACGGIGYGLGVAPNGRRRLEKVVYPIAGYSSVELPSDESERESFLDFLNLVEKEAHQRGYFG